MGEVLALPRHGRSTGMRFPRPGSVNAVGLEARADELTALAVEGASRLQALELAVRLVELTALETTETPGSTLDACARAAAARVAAVRVRPRFVPLCRHRLDDTGVRVVVPATAPEARHAVALGADEVVLHVDHGALVCRRFAEVFDEIAWLKATVEARVTVSLETAALGTYDIVRRASLVAMIAGADFVGDPAPPPASALCMLEAIRDVRDETGRSVGFKAGGICGVDEAVGQLVLVHETLGSEWLTPERSRIDGPRLLEELSAEVGAARRSAPQA